MPLNLVVSLVALAAAVVTRWQTRSREPLATFTPELPSSIGGAIVAAFLGTSLAGGLSDERREQGILVLLVVMGGVLIVEGFLPSKIPPLVPSIRPSRIRSSIG